MPGGQAKPYDKAVTATMTGRADLTLMYLATLPGAVRSRTFVVRSKAQKPFAHRVGRKAACDLSTEPEGSCNHPVRLVAFGYR
jgi:hypothetical protein